MRRFQKRQMLTNIANLHIIHQQNRERLLQKEYAIIQATLAGCQEAVIQMGESIERMEGIGKAERAIQSLEQYCEKLYQVNLKLEEISAEHFYDTLEEALLEAEKAIDRMPEKKEIVFLPYKASMWDSLESVYLAAKEDENCDAYVVPIPYYDKNADGSLGEMHYEGSEYPKNIEITPYEEYNLEERRPDAIYIHNPYDDKNYVTCVPERYFSSHLRNYTEQLVYIPYFILEEIKPDEQDKIDKIKHFCFLPGTIYAHKVIVQSEDMRQIYINEYIKAARLYGCCAEDTDRTRLEKKILGLGSPKLDRVRGTDKEELEVPEDWKRIIKKADGTWKKIILYNTSVNALLQHDEQMFRKIRSVFAKFREAQDAVTLLWRPHPLAASTLQALRPQMLAEYEHLVEEYQKDGFGIYDDSADVDRAVILSDAYYGDFSSVVYLYQETGKPVMIQAVDVL